VTDASVPTGAEPDPQSGPAKSISGEDTIGTVRLGAGEAAGAARPALDPWTRPIAAGWLALFLFALWFLASQAMKSDLGTEDSSLRNLVKALAILIPGYPAALAAMALVTGKRPPRAWDLLSLPFEGWWYAGLQTLAWREIRAFFYRPVGYFVLFFWMVVNGFFFLRLIEFYGGMDTLGQDFQQPPTGFVTGNWVTFFLLVITCPALTMRLLSDEQAKGTFETLLTAPVTPVQVVLSKYLGVLTFYVSMLAGIGLFLVVLRLYAEEWDWGPVAGGFLGLLLVGMFFLAIGTFASSLTDNQVVAFLVAILPNLLMFPVLLLLENVQADPWRKIMDTVHVWQMHQDFIRGVVQWKSLVFFGSTISLFLFLAVRGVESHRWR